MPYRIIFSKHAAKAIKKLPQEIKDRIELSLLRIRTRPYDFLDKLVSSPYYKLRIGEYRVILDIIDNDLVILIVEVGHRRNLYKRFK